MNERQNEEGGAMTQSRPGGEMSRDVIRRFTPEQRDLIKDTFCKGATDDELRLFIYVGERTGLDPFTKQIHAVKRWDNDRGRFIMTIQTGIDGYRVIAHRTGEIDGTEGPFWCGSDGEWKDVWLIDEAPVSAKFIVWRKGHGRPYVGIARFNAYVQRKKGGDITHFWRKMPDNQIAKCAEALAYRKAFPQDLSGIYSDDEMQQADDEPKLVRGTARVKNKDKSADKGEDPSPEEQLAVLQKKLLHILKQVTGIKGDKPARKKLEALTGFPHESKLPEEIVRQVGRALEIAAKGGAKVDGNQIVSQENGDPLWAGPVSQRSPEPTPSAPAASEEESPPLEEPPPEEDPPPPDVSDEPPAEPVGASASAESKAESEPAKAGKTERKLF